MKQTTFRFVLEDSPQVQSVSEEASALLGFTPSEFVSGKVAFKERIHPDDADVAQILFSSATETRAGIVNLRFRNANGRICCLKGEYKKDVDLETGKLLLTLALRDVRGIEEPGDLSLIANFKTLLENTTDYIYVKNCNHVFLAATNAVAELTTTLGDGMDLAGKTDYDLHPEQEADRYYRLEKQLFLEGQCVNEIQQVLARDGTKHWIDNRKYPVNGSDGKIAGLFGIAPDVTPHLEEDQKLIENERSLREAQRIAGLGSFALDIPARKWKVSAELDALLGIDSGYNRAFEGLWPLIHPDDRAAMAERYQGYFSGERKHYDNEYRIIRQNDKAVRWVRTRGRLEFDEHGKPLTLHGTMQDITDQKQAAIALLESEQSLQLAQEIANLCSYTLDIRAGIWKGSETLEGILGIGPAHPRTIAGWVALLHPEDRARMADSLDQNIERHAKSFDADYRIVRPSDGVTRWLKGRGWIEYANDGAPIFLHGTIQDITESKQTELALRESKQLLQLFIKQAPVAIAMLDCKMRYLAVSEHWRQIHKLDCGDILGRSHYEVFPDLPPGWTDEHRRALAGEIIQAGDGAIKRPDGSLQCLRRRLHPWFTGNGAIGGIIIFAEDITSQKRAEERLQLAASVFAHASEGIVVTDSSGAILDVNDTFARVTGYTREELLGRNPRILKSGLQNDEFYRKMWRSLLESGHWSGEIWNRTKSGELYVEMLSISAICDGNGKVLRYVALFSDVTELKNKQAQLEKIAHYDVLTGLPNRVLLSDRLRQAMSLARRRKQLLAVAFLDLDGFKEINDNYGHVVGDQLLRALASRMKFVLREGDTIARLGGDEFVALLLDLPDTDAALPVLNRLLDVASRKVRVESLSLRVSSSIGVAYYSHSEEIDADQLLRQADQAMYQAKTAGKNRFHFFDPMQASAARSRHESLERIQNALAKCQFVLHYQPKVNMRTGQVVGVEALLRMQHPERGLLFPDAFLPAIEDHPLAVEVGAWGVRSVLEQMETWQGIGLDLPVSVNISSIQLQHPDFVARLQSKLEAHPHIEPANLELEVLETSALQDVIQASEVLEACHRLGVSIALDDFGTGYSSLTYLKRLPAHVIKIDRSFVSGMVDDPEDLAIVEGVLSLAKAFGRKVIAEGVETPEHGLMLLQLGCEIAQGYGIARPMPASDLPAWLATWRPDPRWAYVEPLHNGQVAMVPVTLPNPDESHRSLAVGDR